MMVMMYLVRVRLIKLAKLDTVALVYNLVRTSLQSQIHGRKC